MFLHGYTVPLFAGVAQLVEHGPEKAGVGSSILPPSTNQL